MPEELKIMKVGLCTMVVCAPVGTDPAEVGRFANRVRPTGIASSWEVEEAERLADGQEHPAPCEAYPAENRHWMLMC